MTAETLIIFFIGGVVMVGAGIITSNLVAPSSKNKTKAEPFECGVETEGPTWIQFKVGYYLFAILFLIFDVETVLVVPWAVVMKKMGMVAFVEIVIFFLILGLGLIYAWHKEAFKWE